MTDLTNEERRELIHSMNIEKLEEILSQKSGAKIDLELNENTQRKELIFEFKSNDFIDQVTAPLNLFSEIKICSWGGAYISEDLISINFKYTYSHPYGGNGSDCCQIMYYPKTRSWRF